MNKKILIIDDDAVGFAKLKPLIEKYQGLIEGYSATDYKNLSYRPENYFLVLLHSTYINDNVAPMAINAFEEYFKGVLVYRFSGKQITNNKNDKLIARENLKKTIERVIEFYNEYEDDSPTVLEKILLYENYDNQYKEILKMRLINELPETPPFYTLFDSINFERLLLLYGSNKDKVTKQIEQYKSKYNTFEKIETHIINKINVEY
jgi:hypothetical protein